MLCTVGAHDLEEHLTGVAECPSPFVMIKTGSGVSAKQPNSQFHT